MKNQTITITEFVTAWQAGEKDFEEVSVSEEAKSPIQEISFPKGTTLPGTNFIKCDFAHPIHIPRGTLTGWLNIRDCQFTELKLNGTYFKNSSLTIKETSISKLYLSGIRTDSYLELCDLETSTLTLSDIGLRGGAKLTDITARDLITEDLCTLQLMIHLAQRRLSEPDFQISSDDLLGSRVTEIINSAKTDGIRLHQAIAFWQTLYDLQIARTKTHYC